MYGNDRCESGVFIESVSDSNTEFTNDFIKTILSDIERPRSSGKVMPAYWRTVKSCYSDKIWDCRDPSH